MRTLRSLTGTLHKHSLLILLFGIALLAPTVAAAEDLAIKGYDPVSYFTAGKAQQGSDAYSFSWHGKTWQFVSREHRDLFAADPEKYAPQFDGYCAWAMTESRLAITDPEVWKIVDGKLYLNCSREAYEKWSRDIPGHIRIGNENWKKMQGGMR